MPTTYAPGSGQWVGIATETTYGTAASVPTLWVPVDTPVFTPGQTMLIDTAMRGSMATDFNVVAGMRGDRVTFKTNVYLDSCFAFLRGLLGVTDVPTGVGPYTHKTSLLASTTNNGAPAGTTVFFNAADKTWQLPGAIISDVKVTIKPDQLATIDVTYEGLIAVPITAPANTPTTVKPMPSWNCVITIGGTAYQKYSEITLDFKRDTKVIPTITGSQSYFAVYAGAVTVTGAFAAVYEGSTDNDLVGYLTNVQPAFSAKISPAGDSVNSLTFQHSQLAYDTAAFAATNQWFEIKSGIRALANATDAIGGGLSPAQVILVSPTSTAI